jgi:hypothetical protein
MPEQFISAPIRPVIGTFDATRMSTGEPGIPQQFKWGRRTIQVARVLKSWRETGPCHHGSGETYLRKHWYQVLTDSGDTMKIYFERQPRARTNKSRWRLFAVEKSAEADTTASAMTSKLKN